MAHGSSHPAGERLADFGTRGVVVHGRGVVLGIGEDRAGAADDGDARAGLAAGPIGPGGQRGRLDGGQRGREDARLALHLLLGVLQFAIGGVAGEEDVGGAEGDQDQDQRGEEEFAEERHWRGADRYSSGFHMPHAEPAPGSPSGPPG